MNRELLDYYTERLAEEIKEGNSAQLTPIESDIATLSYDEIDKKFPKLALYQAAHLTDSSIYTGAPFSVGVVVSITSNEVTLNRAPIYQIGISHDSGQVYTRLVTFNVVGKISFTAWETKNATTDYVDEQIGDMDTALDSVIASQESILAMQNALIGGDA